MIASLAVALAAAPGEPAPTTTTTKPAAGAGAPAAAAPATPLKETKVSDKTYLDVVVKPAQKQKHAIFVDFWASYCVPCLDELPGLVAMKERLGKDVDIAFVSVDPASADLPKVLAKRNVTLASTFRVDTDDPQHFINAVDPKWMGEVPFGALYDKNGKLVQTFSGEQQIDALEKLIREALAKK